MKLTFEEGYGYQLIIFGSPPSGFVWFSEEGYHSILATSFPDYLAKEIIDECKRKTDVTWE